MQASRRRPARAKIKVEDGELADGCEREGKGPHMRKEREKRVCVGSYACVDASAVCSRFGWVKRVGNASASAADAVGMAGNVMQYERCESVYECLYGVSRHVRFQGGWAILLHT